MNADSPLWGKPTKQYMPTFDPVTAANPTEHLFAGIAAWKEILMLAPLSPMAVRMAHVGYIPLYIEQIVEESVFLCLRASASDVVELQSIHANPAQHGHGSALLRRLCDLAEETGVTLWLDARPFGSGRHITFGRLQAWYRRFGFERVSSIPTEWLVETHGTSFIKRASLMLRSPRVA